MIDILTELAAIHRETGRGKLADGDARTVVARRHYDAQIDDVWDAITTPERLTRWFLPVTGDLRLGGRYQLEGNAGGEILQCEAPTLLVVSWVMGDGPSSEVQVRLTAGAEGATDFELTHTAIVEPAFWDQFGPGAVGVGWDLALLGLALHLRAPAASGHVVGDPVAWSMSDEGRQFARGSSEAWGAANLAAGADPRTVAAMVAATSQFYAPDPAQAAEDGPDRQDA